MKFGLLKGGLFTGEIRDFGTDTPPDISHKNLEWRVFRRDPTPVFNPVIEKLGPETIAVFSIEIVASHSVLTLTQVELDGLDENKIVSAMLDLGFIVIKLVDKLISKNVIAAADFDTETKQEYLSLKTLVDKLRP